MANYQDFPTSMWETLIDYSPDSKLLFFYLWTNPNSRPSGLYKISLRSISYYLGLEISPLQGALEGLIRGFLVEYDFQTYEVWIKDKFKHIPKLFVNPNMQKSIETDIKVLESGVLRASFLSFYEGACKGLVSPPSQSHSQSHSQDQEKKKGSGEKEKHLIETPTRDNSNQDRWSYPPDVQALVRSVAKRKSAFPENKA